ncbi:carbon monoxide dehydrogenase accessory protein CooC [soil metagenome]
MRVAIAGKGGAGKTTISSTLARLHARLGIPVVAIDADSNPNLAWALGIDPLLAAGATSLPSALVSRRPDGPRLTAPLEDVLAEHTIPAPDGVRLATMGMPDHADTGCLCAAHATVSAVLADLGDRPEVTTIIDLEASPEHLSRGTARHADVLVLVAEPYYRSLETVGRLAALAAELPIPRVAVVANKLRSQGDADAVGEYCDRRELELLAEVPWSTEALDADAARTPLLDAYPDAPVIDAIAGLAEQLAHAVQLGTTPGAH